MKIFFINDILSEINMINTQMMVLTYHEPKVKNNPILAKNNWSQENQRKPFGFYRSGLKKEAFEQMLNGLLVKYNTNQANGRNDSLQVYPAIFSPKDISR